VSPQAQSIVLVVEDDPQLRELYRMTLRSAGYAVIAVEDGLDALQFTEQVIPAAVVLDLGLPRVGGRDVQQELAAHQATRDVPIILVTGDPLGLSTRAIMPASSGSQFSRTSSSRRCRIASGSTARSLMQDISPEIRRLHSGSAAERRRSTE
jgi:CheY-like chemotaxis protein